jgi:serine/threonine protein phosphatase PrpC
MITSTSPTTHAPRTAYDTTRDHRAHRLGPAALVSDRGRRRERNEDAAAITVRPHWTGLVVADGVGGSPDGDRASAAAVQAGRDALAAARDHDLDGGHQLLTAVHAAAAAVGELGRPGGEAVAPSTTIVAAVAEGRSITAVSVGDSRAYWLPDHGTPMRLTVDDSYLAERLALGADPTAVAREPFAHAITAWLGAGGPPLQPQVAELTVDGPGWLLLATDGFWQHLPEPCDRSALVVPPSPADPLALGESLVRWANDLGAPDNVTVALTRVA